MSVSVFFDYTCGFSNRARHWLDALHGVEVTWRPFSLLQQNHGEGPVFDREEYADNVSLVALAVHEQVRARGGDVDAYRRRMFTAWHEEPGRLSAQDILKFGRTAGLRTFDHGVAFAALAAEHTEAVRLGVFGTPTLVFAAEHMVFVKLDAVPEASRAQPLWEVVRQLAVDEPALREWQRVSPPGG